MNGDTYSDDVNDYSPRCRSCHLKHDMTDQRKENVAAGIKRTWVKRPTAILVDIDGEMMPLKRACESLGLQYHTIYARIKYYGWPIKKALAK